jgi:hypothetical protein
MYTIRKKFTYKVGALVDDDGTTALGALVRKVGDFAAVDGAWVGFRVVAALLLGALVGERVASVGALVNDVLTRVGARVAFDAAGITEGFRVAVADGDLVVPVVELCFDADGALVTDDFTFVGDLVADDGARINEEGLSVGGRVGFAVFPVVEEFFTVV